MHGTQARKKSSKNVVFLLENFFVKKFPQPSYNKNTVFLCWPSCGPRLHRITVRKKNSHFFFLRMTLSKGRPRADRLRRHYINTIIVLMDPVLQNVVFFHFALFWNFNLLNRLVKCQHNLERQAHKCSVQLLQPSFHANPLTDPEGCQAAGAPACHSCIPPSLGRV